MVANTNIYESYKMLLKFYNQDKRKYKLEIKSLKRFYKNIKLGYK